MNVIKVISSVVTVAVLSGCASTYFGPAGSSGPAGTTISNETLLEMMSKSSGPKLVTSGVTTESSQYGEVGVQFSTMGDFLALFTPNRWKSPIATGGSLSWLNPQAWSDDAGRTGRILLGEAVVFGGVIAASSGDGNDSGNGGGSTGPTAPSSGGAGMPPGGGVLPPFPSDPNP